MGLRQVNCGGGMEPITVFSSKAEKYARYRWRYAPEAIQAIFAWAEITNMSCVADIGAGTGILTREFIGKAGQIFAVEPNPEMRAIAARDLSCFPACQVIDARAEATTLADNSVDLVTAAQAVHWFEPEAARREFYRILKPGGWLALCRNLGTNRELGQALDEVYPAELDTAALMVGHQQPRSFYYGSNDFSKMEFPFKSKLSWEAFLGSLLTASSAPDEGSPFYAAFARKARRIFDDFRVDEQIEIAGMTELYLGEITKL